MFPFFASFKKSCNAFKRLSISAISVFASKELSFKPGLGGALSIDGCALCGAGGTSAAKSFPEGSGGLAAVLPLPAAFTLRFAGTLILSRCNISVLRRSADGLRCVVTLRLEPPVVAFFFFLTFLFAIRVLFAPSTLDCDAVDE